MTAPFLQNLKSVARWWIVLTSLDDGYCTFEWSTLQGHLFQGVVILYMQLYEQIAITQDHPLSIRREYLVRAEACDDCRKLNTSDMTSKSNSLICRACVVGWCLLSRNSTGLMAICVEFDHDEGELHCNYSAEVIIDDPLWVLQIYSFLEPNSTVASVRVCWPYLTMQWLILSECSWFVLLI